MLTTILQYAVRCGVFEKNISIEPFRERVSGQFAVTGSSVVKTGEGIFMICERDEGTSLIILSRQENVLDPFTGVPLTIQESGITCHALECPLDHKNAVALRKAIPWTAPSALDARRTFGCGDRIGGISPATPWHIEACLKYNMTPVLAQQSVRENTKTGRTFESVLDDVTWSVLRSGYKLPWGADADHLKTLEEIDAAVRTGYTMFTLDPSDMIDYAADTDSDDVLKKKMGKLFSDTAHIDSFIERYEGQNGADSRAVVRSAVKYLAAVRHAVSAYKRIIELKKGEPFNFEMSIDETATPTTPLDHRIIATELIDEGVVLFSLAPRFEGRFEKGVDYIGAIDGFRRSLEQHVSLADELGGYRLSLHSGSDKFTVYPIFGEVTDGYYHVKTAGTSFLEAVKAVAQTDFEFFREILSLAVETFEENAASYDISADISRVPDPAELSSELAVIEITENDHMRQTLHIAFGKIMKTMGDRMRILLRNNRDAYRNNIVTHIGRHLELLTGA